MPITKTTIIKGIATINKTGKRAANLTGKLTIWFIILTARFIPNTIAQVITT